jgi:hypothetical protein
MPQAAAAKIINVISPLIIPAIQSRLPLINPNVCDDIDSLERSIKGIATTAIRAIASDTSITKDTVRTSQSALNLRQQS